MANYLPVLLVSVNANAVPDDSSLVTLPRGQVDYLSHDWQEEDVWRSWRNMTRKKNEITNGVRLENASWRTWWKQRNKLKTISPETLNWLKDSDVTWLYGPLHTAVEWTPPPKPKPVPDTVDSTNPASAHDRFDLSESRAKVPSRRVAPYKPILKHRSISELLTSDLPPTSPIFSPVESEDESTEDSATRQNTVANGADPTSLVSHSQFSSKLASKATSKRPSLIHTKSDTHITRWGANRAFRKDSPPRIDPPGLDPSDQSTGYFPPVPPSSSSSSSLASTSHTPSAASGSIRSSLSQDSTTSSENTGGVTSGGDSRGSHSHSAHHTHPHANGQVHKKKHISFNTFVEQCIAIEKPKKNASGYFGFGVTPGALEGWHGKVNYLDDDGYDEDEEDSDEEDDDVATNWQTQTPRPRHSGAIGVRNDSDSAIEGEDEEEDEDGVIEMRASIHQRIRTPKPTPSKKQPRSQSIFSTTSSSSSTSTSTTNSYGSESNSNSTLDTSNSSPSGSLSPSRRSPTGMGPSKAASSSSSSSSATAIGRRASTSSASTTRPAITRRGPHPPPLIRTTSDSTHPRQRPPYSIQHPQREHVTIAPIAPTILKTTGAWSEGFGDEGASDDGISAFGVGGGGWGWDSTVSSSSSSATISGPTNRSRSGGSRRNGSRSPSVEAGNSFGTFGMGRGSSRAFGITIGQASQEDEEAQESDGTPVELVYVPTLSSHYSMGLDESGMGVTYDGYTSPLYGPGYGVYRQGYGEDAENEDGAEVEQVEDVAQADLTPYDASTSTSPGSSAPIQIAGTSSHRNHSRHIPSVVVNDPSGTVHPSSLPSSYRSTRPIPVTKKDEEEDAYDFFEGPDLGEEYYYARRGGRGYERDRGSTAESEGKEKSNPSAAPIVTSFGSLGVSGGRERDSRDRGSDRRHSRSRDRSGFGGLSPAGGTEERQSRSRSRSHSRTPSPALTGSTPLGGTSAAEPSTVASTLPHGMPYSTVTVGGVGIGSTRRRSASTSSPSLGPELLSPAGSTRGRQDGPSSFGGRDSRSSSSQQQPSRGRSSTRISSSSSLPWERERSGSLGSSPIGSLSPGPGPDSRSASGLGIGSVLGSALAGGGRAERDGSGKDRDRARERRGRDRTSGKILSASETESPVGKPSEAVASSVDVDADSVAESVVSASSNSKTVAPGASPMDASFYSSTTSSSSGSTTTSTSNSTIKAVPVDIAPVEVDRETMYFRLAEEEQRRRVHPTPSNSPVVEMRRRMETPPPTRNAAADDNVETPKPTSGSSGSGSGGTTPTGAGTTSPPLSEVLTPSTTPSSASAVSVPAQGQGHHRTSSSISSITSTSLLGGISASQPALTASPSKLRPPPLIPPPAVLVQPSTSFTAVVSPRSPSLGRSRPARKVSISTSSARSDSPAGDVASASSNTTNTNLNATIVGKAVDMVSSAGAFLGLWGRDSAEGH